MEREPAPAATAGRNLPIGRLIAGGIVLVVLITFVFQNRAVARIRFLFFETDTSLAWALLIAGALGVVVGLAVPRLRRLFNRRKA